MNDINKLRRLAQAATPGPDGVSLNWLKLLQDFQKEASPAVITELLDRIEAAEKEREKLRTLVVMRCDLDCPPQFTQGHEFHEFTEPVTAEHCRWFVAEIERLRTDCDALRAKIEQMEKQEPVAQVGVHKTGGNAGIAWSARPLNEFDSLPLLREGDKLYLAPGAQPAPSIPEGWLRAIDEALVVAHIGVANADDTYEQAKSKLENLIGFHVEVATDPAVNGGYKLAPIEPTP